ncbi:MULTISPECIES: DUF2515 family protein [Bacillus]|uniref:DUF2515 family protein n=1 Tax=Bacillus TaxID=1386 RepID=UPI000BB82908|nr:MULTISPECIES: DUF2515 family protein [Bacillus]
MSNSNVSNNIILTGVERDFIVGHWFHSSQEKPATKKEETFILHAKQETAKHNVDNVTRTNAYWNFYKKNPEVHWAFLAHMVSRNGGWNMTDLKGSIVPNFLPYNETSVYFSFLEKANYLIFHDAYPQLLLYEQSKMENKSLFYLLPMLGVSSFMEPIWKLFFQQKNSEMLTYALIINEQNYIEKRVIQNPFYSEHVLNTIPFALQERLGFTKVILPFQTDNAVRLAGVTVSRFHHITSRINVGKQLYNILFKNNIVLDGVILFAENHIHTGSRTDYFPNLFSTSKTIGKVYSPTIPSAWKVYTHSIPKIEDWFQKDTETLDLFNRLEQKVEYDITDSYLKNLLKLTGFGKIKEYLEKI